LEPERVELDQRSREARLRLERIEPRLMPARRTEAVPRRDFPPASKSEERNPLRPAGAGKANLLYRLGVAPIDAAQTLGVVRSKLWMITGFVI
jgi:hypothetical protein